MKIEEYKELDQLENCTAILGNLVLIFPNLDVNDTDEKIIGYNAIEINNRSFPLLTEITGYLGVISVTHLNSLEKMFTNLRVIRGRRLMLNFALFMYETNLIEVAKISFSFAPDFSIIIKTKKTFTSIRLHYEISRRSSKARWVSAATT